MNWNKVSMASRLLQTFYKVKTYPFFCPLRSMFESTALLKRSVVIDFKIKSNKGDQLLLQSDEVRVSCLWAGFERILTSRTTRMHTILLQKLSCNSIVIQKRIYFVISREWPCIGHIWIIFSLLKEPPSFKCSLSSVCKTCPTLNPSYDYQLLVVNIIATSYIYNLEIWTTTYESLMCQNQAIV